MRLARLDLLRYGHFTDRPIELPQAARDLHIVFGPNEAGKTTSLIAIEDLLFGIDPQSRYAFKHGYNAMRIGAVLQNGDELFEFQRRKTRKDMILDADGQPMAGDERLLAPFLGGADRDFFDHMFNLSHSRLAAGGKAILAAEGDVGQMLFAAGTGLADLRERLKQLEEEADGLWSKHKSGKRLYYQAQDRLEDARSRQRDHSLTVSAWRTARKAFNDAEKAYGALRQEHDEKSAEEKKLARIHRVHGAVRRRGLLTQEITALGNVVVLAEDAGAQLADAEARDAQIRSKEQLLASQLEEARQALAGITFDEALVRRADEIAQLNEQRIALRKERNDLPRRQDEYRLELEALARLAGEIGWQFDDAAGLIERIPPRGKVEPVRSLLARHRELAVELRGAGKALEEAQAGEQETTGRLAEAAEALDVSGLEAVLKAVREIGDVAGRMRAAQRQAAEASAAIGKKIATMKPALPDGADIEALAVPPRDTVVAHRDKGRDLERRQSENEQRLAEARQALERDKEAVAQRVRDEGVVTPAALEEARGYRDTLWALARDRYVDGREIPAEEAQAYAEALEDLPASFAAAVEAADRVADRRFDKAQDAAELAVLARNMAGHETRIRQLEADGEALTAEGEQLAQAWQALWADVPVEVSGPDAMLVWLEVRDEIETLSGRQRDAQRQVDDERQEEKEAIGQVQAALVKLGWDADEVKADTLKVLLERAEGFRREQEAKAEKISELQEAVRSAKAEVARRQRELEKAEAEQEAWRSEWGTAVAALGLQEDEQTEVVTAQIKIIDEMREHAVAARDLRDKRIETIKRDIAAFEDTVAEVVAALAPELGDGDADAAVVELEQRREEALKEHQRHRELTESVEEKQQEVEGLEESRKAVWVSVQPLFEAAGVEEVEALRAAIQRSDRLRALQGELAGVMETLAQQGDGLAVEALEEECRDVDIDEVRARQEAAEAELKVLAEGLLEAVEKRSGARRDFEAIGGDDAAARAAADRQEALASMQEAAERYVRVRASGMLLRWAIERYRKEKQGPLLKRARALFQVLTRGSFERLEVDADERGNMRLTGVRAGGEVVEVPGLSTGTEDQLFLALRIAAVEEYLSRAGALPFVADDLFINFDEKRSAAGFEVLGQLAEQTQVLFYTHHQHLVDVARETLGADVHVVDLSAAA